MTQEIVVTGKLAENTTEKHGDMEFVDAHKSKFRFKRAKNYPKGEAWIKLLYGASKTGKTYYAGTAGPKTFFINLGFGFETLKMPAFTARYNIDDMIVFDLLQEDFGEPNKAFDHMCKGLDYAIAHHRHEIENIVLDEATALRRSLLVSAMTINNKMSSGNRSNRPNRGDDYARADVDDYMIEMDQLKWFLETYIPIFKEEKLNFLMLAHQRQIFGKPAKIGEQGALEKTLPGFTGQKFPDDVPAFFDDVWYSETKLVAGKSIYFHRTGGSGMRVGGSRHGGLFKPEEEDPNFQRFLQRIRDAA